jgi:hypothetical protein
MADISHKAATEKSEPKLRRDDLEEEDEMESYVNHMKKKGVVVGSNNGIAERDEASCDTAKRDVYSGIREVPAYLKFSFLER